MNVDNVRFSEEVEQGFRGGPFFDVEINRGITGKEIRLLNTPIAYKKYTCSFANRELAFIEEIAEVYYAQRGMTYGFMLKDWFDFELENELIGEGDGAEQDFQITKKYVSYTPAGSPVREYVRLITLPRTSGLVVTINGTPTVAYTLLPDGIITFTAAPANDALIRVTGEFDVPVRFDSELESSMLNTGVGSYGSIKLIELLPD